MPLAFALQLSNCGGIAAQTVSGKYAGRTIIGIGQRLFQEDLGRFAVPRFRKVEVYG